MSVSGLAAPLAMSRTTLSPAFAPLVVACSGVDPSCPLVWEAAVGRRARRAIPAAGEGQADLSARFSTRRTQALLRHLWAFLGAAAA